MSGQTHLTKQANIIKIELGEGNKTDTPLDMYVNRQMDWALNLFICLLMVIRSDLLVIYYHDLFLDLFWPLQSPSYVGSRPVFLNRSSSTKFDHCNIWTRWMVILGLFWPLLSPNYLNRWYFICFDRCCLCAVRKQKSIQVDLHRYSQSSCAAKHWRLNISSTVKQLASAIKKHFRFRPTSM